MSDTEEKKPVYLDVPGVPYLKLNSQSGIYYVRKYKAGRGEMFKSTEETKKARAISKADEMLAEWLGNRRTLRRARIDQIVDELLGVLEQEFKNGDRRKRTYDHDRTYLPIIKELFGEWYGDEFDEEAWDHWVRTEGRKLKRNLFDIAKYLSKVLTFAHARKYINRKPTLKNPDRPTKAGRIYEDQDVITFLKFAEPMLKDLIILAAENPLRPHEVRELRWSMVLIESDAVVLRLPEWFTKTASARELQVSQNAAVMLRRRAEHRSGEFVFPSPKSDARALSDVQLSRMWRRMLAAVNDQRMKAGRGPLPEGLKFHWLRHSFYSKALLDARLPVQLVSEAGGTSISTLQKRYLHSDARRTSAVSKAVNLQLPDFHEFFTNQKKKKRD